MTNEGKGIIKDYSREDQILERLYQSRGVELIKDLAKLSGMEARMKILEISGDDINPGEEQ